PVATNDLVGWSTAMYTAAGLVYASAKRLPDRMWVSTDVWGKVGPVIDTACCSNGAPGASSISSFAGNLFSIDRVVVPSFPAGTAIVGWSGAFEVYEEVIGLLTAVEPSLPRPRLLDRPDPTDSRAHFVGLQVEDYLWHGNALALVTDRN